MKRIILLLTLIPFAGCAGLSPDSPSSAPSSINIPAEIAPTPAPPVTPTSTPTPTPTPTPITAITGCNDLPAIAGHTFYVDPINGSMTCDGSSACPWRTLQEVFAAHLVETRKSATSPYVEGGGFVTVNPDGPVKPGDMIVLRTGYHGVVSFSGGYNTDYITIRGEPGHTPTLGKIDLKSVDKWRFQCLAVSPEFMPQGTGYLHGTIVGAQNHSWTGPTFSVEFSNLHIFSTSSTQGWTLDDWNTQPSNGIVIDATESGLVHGNVITNVIRGVIFSGQHVTIENNTVANFTGDGLRGSGDDHVLQYNLVKNVYNVNDDHNDGIQFYSGGLGDDRNILRGNIIIQNEDPNQPFAAPLQGIGCFDGPYYDWTVENNLILVGHYHGISLYGAVNGHITNNTVYGYIGSSPTPIRLVNGVGNTVRNNLSTSYSLEDDSLTNDHNLVIGSTGALPADLFVDYLNGDFRLNAASPAINAGSGQFAPSIDILQHSRDTSPDLGAYEFTP